MKITEGGTIEISVAALGKPAEFTLTLGGEDPVDVHLAENVKETIIYQTEWGDRFEVRSRLIETGCRSKNYASIKKEKRLKKKATCQYTEYYFL